MKKRSLVLAALASTLFAAPSAARACDLDGMAGMHRFNPFGQVPGFRGLAPPPPPPPTKAATAKPQNDSKGDRLKTNKRRAEEIPVREWEQDTGNGPVSDEDKATFT